MSVKQYEVDSILDFSRLSMPRAYKATESVSQRESLKAMLLKKFLDQYGRKSVLLTDEIVKEISYYFNFEQINESGLRILKQRVDRLAKSPQFQATHLTSSSPKHHSDGSMMPAQSRKQRIEEIIQAKMQPSSSPLTKINHNTKHATNNGQLSRSQVQMTSLPNLMKSSTLRNNATNNLIQSNASALVLESTPTAKIVTTAFENAPQSRSQRLSQAGQRVLLGGNTAATVSTPQIQLPSIETENIGAARNRNSLYSDAMSVSSVSSKKPVNLLYLEGREEDEWAQIVKFDTLMFQKEQDMAKQRALVVKQKLKEELERQLQEKERKRNQEKNEQAQYDLFQEESIRKQQEADNLKQAERQKRILAEQKMIEQQVQNNLMLFIQSDELFKLEKKKRVRNEQKQEKSIDDAMITCILREQSEIEEKTQKKKVAEKQRQAVILEENKINKQKAENEVVAEKKEDVRLQKLYGELLDQQEATREREKQERLNKISSIQQRFENVVEHNRRETLKRDDLLMLEYQSNMNRREEEKEQARSKRIQDQKNEVRTYLDKQIGERNQQRKNEKDLDMKQAQIWAKDREEYLDHENKKSTYIASVNKQHQKVLVDQIRNKSDAVTKGKMSIEELKHNQNLLQRIADQAPDLVQFAQSNETEIKRHS